MLEEQALFAMAPPKIRRTSIKNMAKPPSAPSSLEASPASPGRATPPLLQGFDSNVSSAPSSLDASLKSARSTGSNTSSSSSLGSPPRCSQAAVEEISRLLGAAEVKNTSASRAEPKTQPAPRSLKSSGGPSKSTSSKTLSEPGSPFTMTENPLFQDPGSGNTLAAHQDRAPSPSAKQSLGTASERAGSNLRVQMRSASQEIPQHSPKASGLPSALPGRQGGVPRDQAEGRSISRLSGPNCRPSTQTPRQQGHSTGGNGGPPTRLPTHKGAQ